MNELADKKAVVTGAGSGIGKATAVRFAEEGASDVIAADINLGAAAETAEFIRDKYGCRSWAVEIDVGNPDDIEKLFSFTVMKAGRLDVLVNCAGICPLKPIEQMSVSGWNRTMNINIRSIFLSCRKALPIMRTQKSGAIVNVSSISGRIGGIATGIDYATSKGAVVAFTKSLAKISGPDQITVNAVAPGFIDTAMTANFKHFEISSVPLRRIGKAEEVADVILFLCSYRSRYITGCTIDVTGGVYMG